MGRSLEMAAQTATTPTRTQLLAGQPGAPWPVAFGWRQCVRKGRRHHNACWPSASAWAENMVQAAIKAACHWAERQLAGA